MSAHLLPVTPETLVVSAWDINGTLLKENVTERVHDPHVPELLGALSLLSTDVPHLYGYMTGNTEAGMAPYHQNRDFRELMRRSPYRGTGVGTAIDAQHRQDVWSPIANYPEADNWNAAVATAFLASLESELIMQDGPAQTAHKRSAFISQPKDLALEQSYRDELQRALDEFQTQDGSRTKGTVTVSGGEFVDITPVDARGMPFTKARAHQRISELALFAAQTAHEVAVSGDRGPISPLEKQLALAWGWTADGPPVRAPRPTHVLKVANGDSGNDIDLLEQADVGAIGSNASKVMKTWANRAGVRVSRRPYALGIVDTLVDIGVLRRP